MWEIHTSKISYTRDLCLCALDTNLVCAKSVRRNEEYYAENDFGECERI